MKNIVSEIPHYATQLRKINFDSMRLYDLLHHTSPPTMAIMLEELLAITRVMQTHKGLAIGVNKGNQWLETLTKFLSSGTRTVEDLLLFSAEAEETIKDFLSDLPVRWISESRVGEFDEYGNQLYTSLENSDYQGDDYYTGVLSQKLEQLIKEQTDSSSRSEMREIYDLMSS